MAFQPINQGPLPADSKYIAAGKSNNNFSELYGRVANAADYGAIADGSTPLHTAIAAALSAGVRTLVLDEGPTFYNVPSAFSLVSGFSLIAGKGRPTLKWNNAASSRMLTVSGLSDVKLIGLEIDGNKAVAPVDVCMVFNGGSMKCVLDDCHFLNLPGLSTGGITFSGGATRNSVIRCQFDNLEGTAVGISGAHENFVIANQMRSYGLVGGWGVGIQSGSHRNEVMGNYMLGGTGEGVVVQYDCGSNRIIANHCTGTGDNGISISGYANTVQGNISIGNAKAGIGVWGSENSIVGNICKNNNFGDTAAYWAGIWCHAQYGGTGSFNTITGNVLDDDQTTPTQNYGVRMQGNGYTTWATGQTIPDLSDFTNTWRVYGLNLYLAKNTGTMGATPPTHTSGTVSDGGISWQYVTTFTGAVNTLWNTVAHNIVRRSKTAQYFDADGWTRNVLVSDTVTSFTITGDGLVRARSA